MEPAGRAEAQAGGPSGGESPRGFGPIGAAIVRISDVLNRAAYAFVIVDLALMSALVIADVVARTTVASIIWSEELGVRFLGTWFVFVGASVAFKQGQLVSLNFFVERLPASVQLWIARIGAVLVGAFIVSVLYSGIAVVLFTFDQPSPVMGIPMGLAYLGVPVGAALMVVHALALLVQGRMLSGVATAA